MTDIHKPLYYSISPISNINEERIKFNEISEFEKSNVISVPSLYLGNSTGALNSTLINFIKNNINYKGPLIIAINAHSVDDSNSFQDHEFKNNFIFDFNKLWYGYLYFDGLEKILNQYWCDKPVYIIFSHSCGNGEPFLKQLVNDYSIPKNVVISTLDTGHTVDSDLSRQVQLCKYIDRKFNNEEEDVPKLETSKNHSNEVLVNDGIQSPTIATKILISENPSYSEAFKKEFENQSKLVHIANELNNNKISLFKF